MPDQTGSAQIHVQARPDLCWQAAGNGSPVTLEHCSSAEGQQWTLTGNGVLMNGDGYCLQAGPTLLVGFDGQCGGGAGQRWSYRGATGGLASVGQRTSVGQGTSVGHGTSAGQGTCAVPGGLLAPGTPIVSGGCDGGTRWSLGSGVIPVQSVVSPRPQVSHQRIAVHAVSPVATPAAGPGAAGGPGLLLAGLLAGLLLVAGATLVFFGRRSRSRRHPAGRPAPDPIQRRAIAGDDGLYVVDVTAEVARRAAQGVVDGRPTEPLDVTSLL